MVIFKSEELFEQQLVKFLTEHSNTGWQELKAEKMTLKVLQDNFISILEQRNNIKLTEKQREEILLKLDFSTGYEAHKFMKGKFVNCTDEAGRQITLSLINKDQDARYQIIRQPVFEKKIKESQDSRGDVMLLINGLPVVHIELKKHDSDLKAGCEQLSRYAQKKVYHGLYSFVQICACMTPNDFRYFARPNQALNSRFLFHWEYNNNEHVTLWSEVAQQFLNTRMVTDFIWYYTRADHGDTILKTCRGYQYHAIDAIVKVAIEGIKGNLTSHKGGYVYCATGGGKTMMAYIVSDILTDMFPDVKVVTLVDRRDLDSQCQGEYTNLKNETDTIGSTARTEVLRAELFGRNADQRSAIITSQQKMLHLAKGMTEKEKEIAKDMRIVFLLDECHRDVEGSQFDSLNLFENRMLFGFTGTPIYAENEAANRELTAALFGNQLHAYGLGEAIIDQSVLGFDIKYITTFSRDELREAVACHEAKVTGYDDPALATDELKRAKYIEFCNKDFDEIEHYIPSSQYETDQHKNNVVEYIVKYLRTYIKPTKYSGLFKAPNILAALDYYERIRAAAPDLKVAVLVDNNGAETNTKFIKQQKLEKAVADYNVMFGKEFSIGSKDYRPYKIDLCNRLAHKGKDFKYITQDQTLDLVIVVNQLTTGYDSKYITVLFCDKVMDYANLVQAMARTNRLEGENKPHGTVIFFQKPCTMYRNVEKALYLYAGSKKDNVEVPSLCQKLREINSIMETIKGLYRAENKTFEESLTDDTHISAFIKNFIQLNKLLKAAKHQGMTWEKASYEDTGFDPYGVDSHGTVTRNITEELYNLLYKNFQGMTNTKYTKRGKTPPYDIEALMSEAKSMKIDEKSICKYLKKLSDIAPVTKEDKDAQDLLKEIYKLLQNYDPEMRQEAKKLIDQIASKDRDWHEGMQLTEEVTKQIETREEQYIEMFAKFGVNTEILKKKRRARDISKDYGEFDAMLQYEKIYKDEVNKQAIWEFVQKHIPNKTIPKRHTKGEFKRLLEKFILTGTL